MKIFPTIIQEEFNQVKVQKKLELHNVVLAEMKEYVKEKKITLNEVLFYLAFEDYAGFQK